jgi:hypothetical protein
MPDVKVGDELICELHLGETGGEPGESNLEI